VGAFLDPAIIGHPFQRRRPEVEIRAIRRRPSTGSRPAGRPVADGALERVDGLFRHERTLHRGVPGSSLALQFGESSASLVEDKPAGGIGAIFEIYTLKRLNRVFSKIRSQFNSKQDTTIFEKMPSFPFYGCLIDSDHCA
jgi:hypothetical protein